MPMLLWMQHASFPGKQSHCVPIPCSREEQQTQGELANSVLTHVVNNVHFLFRPPPHRYLTFRSTDLAPEMQKRGKDILFGSSPLGKGSGTTPAHTFLAKDSPPLPFFIPFITAKLEIPEWNDQMNGQSHDTQPLKKNEWPVFPRVCSHQACDFKKKLKKPYFF